MELRSQRNPKPTAKELLASEWMNPLVNRFYKNIIIRWKQLKNVSYEEKAEFTKVPLISVLLTINKQWYLLSVHISLVAQIVKHLSAMQETWVWSLGPEDPLEKEMVAHSSILVWRIPWTEEGNSPWSCKELDTTEQLIHNIWIECKTEEKVCLKHGSSTPNTIILYSHNLYKIFENTILGPIFFQQYTHFSDTNIIIYNNISTTSYLCSDFLIQILCFHLPDEHLRITWKKVKVKSLSHVWLFVTPWTVAYQAPRFMGFSRQEYWSRLPFPSPGDLPNPGIKPGSPALQTDALPSEPCFIMPVSFFPCRLRSVCEQ